MLLSFFLRYQHYIYGWAGKQEFVTDEKMKQNGPLEWTFIPAIKKHPWPGLIDITLIIIYFWK